MPIGESRVVTIIVNVGHSRDEFNIVIDQLTGWTLGIDLRIKTFN